MIPRLCWVCPTGAQRPATWLQQLDEDRWFTPLCDEHAARADHHNPRYRYFPIDQAPTPPAEDELLILPD